jgi:hypothetical protein
VRPRWVGDKGNYPTSASWWSGQWTSLQTLRRTSFLLVWATPMLEGPTQSTCSLSRDSDMAPISAAVVAVEGADRPGGQLVHAVRPIDGGHSHGARACATPLPGLITLAVAFRDTATGSPSLPTPWLRVRCFGSGRVPRESLDAP